MNIENEILFDVADRLELAGISYMVTGSIALAMYAVPRMTRDIDIIIQISSANAGTVISAFREDYYLDEVTVRDAIRHFGMFNLIHQRTVIKIDFIIRKNEDYRIEEFSRRKQVAIEGKSLWVVAPEDLILSKLVWAQESESELQLRDVKQLMSAVTNMDYVYLRSWAIRLGVNRLLEKAIDHA